MAPLPKRKLSKRRGRVRFNGQRNGLMVATQTVVCPSCKKVTPAHRACRYCGFYKGKKV
ncbi:50S ribosomal protein L32 [Candidatus Gottesmanbacteria bacterium]|nr:50S ribosomal protein L32 [Candidatus Gottesmanbacteria bacterium]